jgi:hypothetical protein
MLKANGGDAIAYLADGTAYKNSSKGVNGSRIAKAVDDQLNAYANSAYGIQEKDDWQVAKLEGSIPESMSFKDYLRKEVMSTAQNYEYSDFSTNKDGAINASRKDAEEKRKEEETIMTGTEGFNTGIIPTDMQFNSGNGQIREQNTVKSWLLGPIFGDQDLTEESKQKAENQQVMLAAKAHNMTPKEYAEKFGKTQNIAVHNYVKDSKRQDLTKLVNNDGAGLLNSAEIVDSEGNRTTLKDFAIKNGSGESAKEVNEWIKENGIQVTGKIDPSAPSAEGYRISMGGNDYIMDLTKNLERKKASGTITKLEQAKLDAHEQERYKAGYVEPVQTAEGPAVRYWDFEKGGYATKPI